MADLAAEQRRVDALLGERLVGEVEILLQEAGDVGGDTLHVAIAVEDAFADRSRELYVVEEAHYLRLRRACVCTMRFISVAVPPTPLLWAPTFIALLTSPTVIESALPWRFAGSPQPQ